ncbi:MAG: prolyl aminopeptidase [Burkholderiales bacterium]|nr:prolyl aminopeptidase [Burkholderiales bacterium]
MSGPLTLYPPLEPADVLQLPVEHGHALHVEVCGAVHGEPVLFLHGGPGSSTNPNHRRFFDPSFYRIVLFDQRGCGRSTPAGETADNTTQDLIADIERLRQFLGVQRWVLFGGSWGGTLALSYAQRHPARVRAMVLRGVFLASAQEVAWFVHGLRAFMPEAWLRFSGGDAGESAAGLLARYHAQVTGADERIAQEAAARWNAYESAVMSVGETAAPAGTFPVGTSLAGTSPADPAGKTVAARVRIHLHYLVNHCFLASQQLMFGMSRLEAVPAIIVQGRRDLVCPPVTAHALHLAWPSSTLRMVEEAGHSALHPAMIDALVRATQDVKQWIEGGRA